MHEVTTYEETLCRPLGFIVSADLGQAADYTAVVVNEWAEGRRLTMTKKPGQTEPVQTASHPLVKHRIRYLHRYSLGTPYPEIVASIKGLMAQLPEMPRKPQLWVDGTGVGRAVIDIFRSNARMNPVSVAITAGDRVNRVSSTEVRIPKRELASLVQSCLQTGRIEIARELILSRTLEDELSNFKVKISLGGNETYEGRSGVHDDLVLALAIAVFAAEKRNDVPGAAMLELARRELAQLRGEDPDAEPVTREECAWQPGSVEHSRWTEERRRQEQP
ncbi:MAG: hypothetical protein ACJ8AW_31430 [Rhodopila sp.]